MYAKDDPKQAKFVASWLSEGKKYKSHGKVIDYSEASDVLKLNVEKIDKDSPVWHKIWELYARSVQFVQQTGAAKLFENDKVSMVVNIAIQQMAVRGTPQRPPPAATGPSVPQQKQEIEESAATPSQREDEQKKSE